MAIILAHDRDFIYFTGTSREGISVGGHYNSTKKRWRVPISIEAINELATIADVSALNNLAETLDKYRKQCYNIKVKEDTIGDERLRNYQRVDVEFLKTRTNSAIFNEQRTGKTPTALLTVADRMESGIIVCPAGLKLVWQRELKRWIGRDSLVISGGAKTRESLYEAFYQSNRIMILSYETLRQDLPKILPKIKSYSVLIADEVHRVRNYQTKQSKALYKIAAKAESILALTGTPSVNHSSDVFGILSLLRPKKFTSYWQFVERYYQVQEGRFGKEVLNLRKDRLAEFTNLLFEISVQRKRIDVMQWVPKVTEVFIELEQSDKQRSAYNKALKEFQYGEEGAESDIPTVLAQLTRLRQICLDPKLLVETKEHSPKTKFIIDYLDDNDGAVIVFSSFTSYLKRLKEEVFPDAVMLTGEQSDSEKQAAVDAIQNGSARLLLSNIRAGGVGWTIDGADTIIFTDRSYNPVDNQQASDRFIPTDENKNYGAKEIIILSMKDTIEYGINNLLDQKLDIISYVNNYMKNGLVDLEKKEL